MNKLILEDRSRSLQTYNQGVDIIFYLAAEGAQIALCGWMSGPAEVTEQTVRLRKESAINTGILRSITSQC